MPVDRRGDFKLFKTTNPFKGVRYGLGMAFYYKCPICDGLNSSKQLEPKDIKCPKCSAKYWSLDNVITKKLYDARRKIEAGKDLIKSATKKPKVIKNARKSSNKDADGLAD